MKGSLKLRGGDILTLPDFTAYCLIHSDGDSADSFAVTFPTLTNLLPHLLRGADFQANEDGKVLFRGVIDEVEAAWGGARATTLCGRGLAARLMDSQAEGAQYFNLDLNTVLERYVRPLGVTAIRVAGGPWRAQLISIGAGTSCRKILQGFCRFAGAPQPRFAPDGTLLIAPGTGRHTLGEEDLLSARWRFCRYGVITEQRVHDLTTGVTSLAEDAVLRTYDIDCRRVAARSGPFVHITERTARQRLEDAAKDLITLELVLPGVFSAQCCDSVQVRLPSLGADGEFTITETCRKLDDGGETTRLTLRAKER